MKLLLLIAISSLSVLADSFDFKCVGTDAVYVNSFSMEGSVDTQSGTIAYDVETRTAGNNGTTSVSTNVVRSATFERVTDPITGDFLGYRAYSVDKNDAHVYVNILMNYPGQLASQIRDVDGRVYRSDCKAL
ncbi:MAG: hypothetical protein CME64_14285 [Halobacteriovoraceae bacterium]|nr:hypothetical protein [Halobacteriovoraceae bacterium]|tara:strand:+ start:59074 stop:59469 length:396 start_codon:yes stop_codon:yes gene_type:complete